MSKIINDNHCSYRLIENIGIDSPYSDVETIRKKLGQGDKKASTKSEVKADKKEIICCYQGN